MNIHEVKGLKQCELLPEVSLVIFCQDSGFMTIFFGPKSNLEIEAGHALSFLLLLGYS